MNPEQQRIAIAKACGWLQSRTCHWGGWWYLKKGKRAYQQTPPDYCNDLNACAEAEKVLTPLQFETFHWILWDLCKSPQVTEWTRAYLSATAAQRAEAFLKTIGKWTSNQPTE